MRLIQNVPFYDSLFRSYSSHQEEDSIFCKVLIDLVNLIN